MSGCQAWSSMTRRRMIAQMGGGFGGLALSVLAGPDREARAELRTGGAAYDLLPKRPHRAPRARAVIQLFMHGGPSHIDLVDPKPLLNRHDGQNPPAEITDKTRITSTLMGSPFGFRKFGRCGMDFSEILPHTARHADELTLIRSMHTGHRNHEQALWMMHTGMVDSKRPTIGAWVVYGLGSESQELPAYVVLPAPQPPQDGIRNWTSGWLPPIFQGTVIRSEGMPIANLRPRQHRPARVEEGRRRILDRLNRQHQAARPGELELEARIANFELAARMQLSATDALDVRQEPEAIQRLYGLDNPVTQSYGARCLMARRLVERGVRFIQIFVAHSAWDTHADNAAGHRKCCEQTDLPVAGLLTDLKQRGLLESTLVFWGGEFGRTPAVQRNTGQGEGGRDHHPYGFSLWLAGGGVKGGHVHGATDEFGYRAVQDPVSVADLHATMLHLLGLDHRRLTYPHLGRDHRLTDGGDARILQSLLT